MKRQKASEKWDDEPVMIPAERVALRLGMESSTFRRKRPALEAMGFPRPDKVLKNMYFWPAIEAWLDERYNLNKSIKTQEQLLERF